MKLLFKLYLLGQLISVPFMIGPLSNVFDNSGAPPPPPAHVVLTDIEIAATAVANHEELCATLNGPAANAVADDMQQLNFITSELYDEATTVDCFGRLPTPTSRLP
jgi:hypothetical protein